MTLSLQPLRLLLVDNRDSFVYNIVELLRRLPAVEFTVVAEGELPSEGTMQTELLSRYDGLVLSPGPGLPEEFPRMMQLLALALGRIPLLGICLGHQALGRVCGAQLYTLERPLHGHASAIQLAEHAHDDPIIGHLSGGEIIGRYHSWAIDPATMPQALEVTAWSRDTTEGEVIMAMHHRQHPAWSVQFHPESMITEDGLGYLAGFASYIRQHLQPEA